MSCQQEYRESAEEIIYSKRLLQFAPYSKLVKIFDVYSGGG